MIHIQDFFPIIPQKRIKQQWPHSTWIILGCDLSPIILCIYPHPDILCCLFDLKKDRINLDFLNIWSKMYIVRGYLCRQHRKNIQGNNWRSFLLFSMEKLDSLSDNYDKTLNLLCHTLTYVSVWCSKYLSMSIPLYQWSNSLNPNTTYVWRNL